MQTHAPFRTIALLIAALLSFTPLEAQTFTAQLLASGTAGSFPALPGAIADVAISGRYAYMAHTTYGIVVADIADPSRPLPIAVGYPNAPGTGIALANKKAYLTAGDKGVFIFNIAASGVPSPLGQFTNEVLYTSSPVAQGDRLYFIDNARGVRALNVSDPANPIEIFRFNALRGFMSLDIQSGPLVAITSSSPTATGHIYFLNPETGDSLANPLPVTDGWHAKLVDSRLYAALGAEFKVYDASNLSNLRLLGSYRSSSIFTRFDVQNGIAYHGSYYGPLRAGNWRNPASPIFYEFSPIKSPSRVTIAGNQLFVAQSTLSIFDLSHFTFDISQTETIPLLANLDTTKASTAPNYIKVVRSGNNIAALNPYRLELHDITNTYRKGSYPLPVSPTAFTSSGNIGIIACGEAGLRIIDMTNPWEIETLSQVDTDGAASGVAMRGSLLLVADGAQGLQPIDLANPSAPVRRTAIALPAPARDVSIFGSLVAVSCGDAGVALFRILDDSNLQPLSVFDSAGSANAAVIRDNQIFIADGSAGLTIVNIADPTNPALLGARVAPSHVVDASLSGNIAIVAAGAAGIHAIDVANPKSPQLLASLKSGTNATSVVAVGPRVSTADVGGFYRTALRSASRIVISNPAAGATLKIGETVKISWRTDSITNSVWPIRVVNAAGAATVITTDAPVQSEDGGWSATWTVTAAAACNYSIRITTQDGAIVGNSGKFCIENSEPASLAAEFANNSIRIHWPTRFTTYKLMSAPSPAGPWSTVSTGIATISPDFVFDVSPTGAAAFYRLQNTP